MAKYIISCCSTADLSREYFNRHEIPLAYFKYTIGDKTYTDDLGEMMPISEFYAKLNAGAMPVTSQVNVPEYVEMFEPFLKEGKDILHISLSSGISGSYNSAKIAQNELNAKYPERNLIVVDSLAASSGYGLLLDTAVALRDGGMEIADLTKWIEANKNRLNHWFFTSDLKHFKRGGRVSATSAVVGTLLGICPIMNVNSEGKLIPRTKVRGKKNTIIEVNEIMKKHAENGTDYSGKCFISNSACLEDARALADIIERDFPKLDGKVEIYDIGTTIGSHTGPGTVALFFWGDEREA